MVKFTGNYEDFLDVEIKRLKKLNSKEDNLIRIRLRKEEIARLSKGRLEVKKVDKKVKIKDKES